MLNGRRVEADHPEATAVRDGVALYAAPGGIPVVNDHEDVSEIIGDAAEPPSR